MIYTHPSITRDKDEEIENLRKLVEELTDKVTKLENKLIAWRAQADYVKQEKE